MKKTNLELKEIDEVVGYLYQRNPKLQDGKFGYAYNRFYTKNIKPLMEQIQEEISDLKVEYAMVDEKTKELLYGEPDQRGNKPYKYDKEGMKKLLLETRKVVKKYESKSVDVIPYFSSVLPEKIEPEEKELLKGCLIK
jgi:hypothetical protein